jgi:hypothetical protein
MVLQSTAISRAHTALAAAPLATPLLPPALLFRATLATMNGFVYLAAFTLAAIGFVAVVFK